MRHVDSDWIYAPPALVCWAEECVRTRLKLNLTYPNHKATFCFSAAYNLAYYCSTRFRTIPLLLLAIMRPCETCGHYDEDAMDVDQEDSSSSGSLLPTSTHPSSVTPSDHYSEFKDFWNQARTALNGAYPSFTRPRNSRVGVLLLSFKDDDLGVIDEIKVLKDVFESSYRYETETWLIPTTESEEALSRKIYQFRRKFCQANRQPNTPLPLLIVYYGGHSAKPPSGGNTCDWSR
jgi:hypothetical protein